jgi:hypothetical protein
MFRRKLPLILSFAFLWLGACVSLDQLPPGTVPGAGGGTKGQSYPDLDASASTVTGIHFIVRSYSDQDARSIMADAENLYNKIMNDTGLYSAQSATMLKIIVYRDREDYATKTHQMASSRVAISTGTLYTYPGPDLDAPLIHQMTHLVFASSLGDKSVNFLWLMEGLAMYEEISKLSDTDRTAFLSNQVNQLRTSKLPFNQMTFAIPNNEDGRLTDAWFAQVESVTAYLMVQGTSQNFASVLNDLKQGLDIDRALSNNYPQKFHSMTDLETAWKTTVPS